MAQSAESIPKRYSYADLEAFPVDNVRREVIDGELIVSPSPITRHQRASGKILFRLMEYANNTGGEAFAAPYDVYLASDNVVEPDLIFVRADHMAQVGTKRFENAPDLVVEISSPSTRHLDLTRKRELYERFGVPEFWFVDLENERVEVYVLGNNGYGTSQIKYSGDTLEPAGLPGLSVAVTQALAAQ